MATRLAVGMQKGGVGKTTTVINLAVGLVMADQSVLVVDADPQGNAASGLGLDEMGLEGLYGMLFDGVPFGEAYESVREPWLDVLPAGEELNAARAQLPKKQSQHDELRLILDQVDDRYDWILVDCPPSLGPLTLNALNAVGELLVPLQSEYYALEGLTQLWTTYQSMRDRLNPELSLLGILITLYDGRTNLADEVKSDVQTHFEEAVFDTVIPRNIRVGEAPGHGQSVIEYAPDSKGSRSYLQFVEEVMHRVGKSTRARSGSTAAAGRD